jgi:hypothetical protein
MSALINEVQIRRKTTTTTTTTIIIIIIKEKKKKMNSLLVSLNEQVSHNHSSKKKKRGIRIKMFTFKPFECFELFGRQPNQQQQKQIMPKAMDQQVF